MENLAAESYDQLRRLRREQGPTSLSRCREITDSYRARAAQKNFRSWLLQRMRSRHGTRTEEIHDALTALGVFDEGSPKKDDRRRLELALEINRRRFVGDHVIELGLRALDSHVSRGTPIFRMGWLLQRMIESGQLERVKAGECRFLQTDAETEMVERVAALTERGRHALAIPEENRRPSWHWRRLQAEIERHVDLPQQADAHRDRRQRACV